MTEFILGHWLDITTTILGLLYIWFEYRASAWLWAVGFLMQTLGIVLYYQKDSMPIAAWSSITFR